MAIPVLGNYFQSTDASTMTAGATSAQLASTSGFVVPAAGQFGIVRVDDVNAGGYNPVTGPFEIIYFTTNTVGTNTLSGFTRAQENTATHAFAAGSVWSQDLTKGGFGLNTTTQPLLPSGGGAFRARAHATANQVLAGSPTNNRLNFPTVDYDPNSNWSTVNSQYTVPVTGVYIYAFQIKIGAAGTATTAQIQACGQRFGDMNIPVGSGFPGFAGSGLVALTAAATVEVDILPSQGISTQGIDAPSAVWFSIAYFSP